MATVESLDTGIVYRNPKPHVCSRHAYFPSVVRLSDGDLVVAMDIGSAFEAVDVRSYACRSSDGGRTWSEPALIFDPPSGPHPFSTTCRVNVFPDGSLIGLANLMERSRLAEGLANPATDGFVRTEWALVQSRDDGRTWSRPRGFESPIDWRAFEACSPIVPLPRGRWLAPTAIWPDWDGRNPHGSKAIVMISDDAGITWPRSTVVMDQWGDRIGHYEQKQVRLTDGRLLAVCWVIDHKTKQNLPNRYTLSSDEGDSYSTPRATPLLGETCTPLALPNNHVLCIYRRADKRGLWAHLAVIEGEDWKALAEAPLWGTNVASHNTMDDSLLAQMSTLRFGCPSATRLPNDEVFATFWCVEDGVSNIRWLKLRVTR